MYCFICVTYMIIITSANPWIAREVPPKQEQRSLFRDVIESLRIRSRPEEVNHEDDNNLSHNYERYGYEDESLQLPSDTDYTHRQNDRIEMPRLKYRFPKNIDITNGGKHVGSKDISDNKKNDDDEQPKEVVVFIDTHNKPPKITQKQKPRPQINKIKANKNKENDDESPNVSTEDYMQLTNTMAGQSQIGNRESQTVIKPTVIVNLRGSVSHTDSDIKLERRGSNNTNNVDSIPRHVFNINQEINLESAAGKKEPNKLKHEVKISKERTKVEEDMMMCETASYKAENKIEGGRKFDNVFQILFSI